MDHRITYSQDECSHLSNTEFFKTKTHISAKIRRTLEQLYHVYQAELAAQDLLTPEGFNSEAVQFVKGEHLEDFPYQYLDYPRFFTREEKLSFRSLFWWGHHVAFSLILEGSLIRQYKQNLINRYAMVSDKQICLCLSPSLWEWKAGAGYTLELTHNRKSEVAAVLANRSFFKLARFIPMNDPLIQTGNIVSEGQVTFRTLLSSITASE